jgi:cobalt-zinc-cadmium efflux system outer membrane protein
MIRTLWLVAGLVIVLGSTGLAQAPAAQPAAAPITLAELEAIALATHPTLTAARAGIEAARGRAARAGTWPNPTVGFSGEELKTGPSDRRGEYGFFFDQPIPLGGKLRLSRAIFDRQATAAEAGLELQRARVLGSVRRAYYRVLIHDRRVEVRERLAALVSEAVGVTAQLFNVGAADRPDFLEAEVAARRVELDVNAAKNTAYAARQELAAVIGDLAVANRPLAGTLDTMLPEIEREASLQKLLAESPELAIARAEAARAEAMTAAARRETYPDLFVRVGGAYNRERGEETGRSIGWEGSLEAGVTIPLFNRNAGGIAAARAEERKAAAERDRLELSLRARYASEFAAYLTATREAEAYQRELLPRAEEAYRLYLARYRQMAAAYPQVLVTQRNLLELTADYLDRLEMAWRSALRLESLLAGDALDTLGTVTDASGGDGEGDQR